jgi:hypothetical protein
VPFADAFPVASAVLQQPLPPDDRAPSIRIAAMSGNQSDLKARPQMAASTNTQTDETVLMHDAARCSPQLGPELQTSAWPVTAEGSFPSRILAVWTRELDVAERVGRVNVARRVRDALQDVAPVSNRRLTNAFEEPRPMRSLLSALSALVVGVLSGRPVPLQCALFAAGSRQSSLLAEGLTADVVYLDGIRTLLLMRRLRRAAPQLRIVVDLDDLMSRRYEHLGRCGTPLPLGYLERMMPRSLSRLALAKNVARVVLWYESLALRNVESEILCLADSVVLLNSTEATALRIAGSGLPVTPRATVTAIRPMTTAMNSAASPKPAGEPEDWHAIFVGSDTLVQNRVTIAYLLDLWASFKIETKLRIYGRQEGHWPLVPNVTFCGYIANIADAYTPGSILVYPCFVPGGIKTKVLEAFAYRIPVVGNASTFEDILPTDYPLVIDEKAALVSLLKDPASKAAEFARATASASAYLAHEHSAGSFADRWRRVVTGP